MSNEMRSSNRRPLRHEYPQSVQGDLQFGAALITWQYDEIERLQLQVHALTNANKSLADRASPEPRGLQRWDFGPHDSMMVPKGDGRFVLFADVSAEPPNAHRCNDEHELVLFYGKECPVCDVLQRWMDQANAPLASETKPAARMHECTLQTADRCDNGECWCAVEPSALHAAAKAVDEAVAHSSNPEDWFEPLAALHHVLNGTTPPAVEQPHWVKRRAAQPPRADDLIDRYESWIESIAIGASDPHRGDSAYNWHRAALTVLKRLALDPETKNSAKASGTAPAQEDKGGTAEAGHPDETDASQCACAEPVTTDGHWCLSCGCKL